MIIILAIDALEFDKVEEFNCNNLKLDYYGKTDISMFSEPRTMVLWSSFMTGKNKEKEILSMGKEMWNKKFKIEETFFSRFNNPVVIDLPGYSYDIEAHEKSRLLLKNYFESKDVSVKEKIKEEYNKDAFAHHSRIKKDFFEALDENHDMILGYFSLADVVGHLSFGDSSLMKKIYSEFDQIVSDVLKMIDKDDKFIILSDHGMKPIGIFGDHSGYGFWSNNFKDMGKPLIIDFSEIIQ